MPELPEVESFRRMLDRHSAGRRIEAVEVADARVVRGDPDDMQRQLPGRTIRHWARRGKHLIGRIDGFDLVVHLGMTGRVRIEPMGHEPDRYYCLSVALDRDAAIRYYDVWRWGEWRLVPEGEAEGAVEALRGMGPEPLGPQLSPAHLARRAAGRKAPVKMFLLDQRNIAGIGNIYADEALHRARIRPERPAGSLNGEELTALHAALVAVLTEAVEQGGAAVAEGTSQGAASLDDLDVVYRPRVYGRAGQPCPTCGTALLKTKLGGRGTTLCPECQI